MSIKNLQRQVGVTPVQYPESEQVRELADGSVML